MVLSDNIYTDIENKKRFNKKLNLIVKGKSSIPFFVVTLPVSSYGILEIYEYNELRQKYYRELDREITVVGVSDSRDGARQLVADILEDHMDQEGVLVWP